MRYRAGDRVLYMGHVYYITQGPIMSTQGSIYSLSIVPPDIDGVLESELQPAPPEPKPSDG